MSGGRTIIIIYKKKKGTCKYSLKTFRTDSMIRMNMLHNMYF